MPGSSFQVRTWSPVLRWAAALLQVLAVVIALGLGVLLMLDVVSGENRLGSLGLAVLLAAGAGAPMLVLAALRAWARATLSAEGDRAVMTGRRGRYELPLAAVRAIRFTRLPLPAPMATFVLASGRTFERWIETDAVDGLLALAPTTDEAAAAFARARSRHRVGWTERIFKYGLFPLLPTVVVFRLHQVITYGGAFGGWQQLGLRRYLLTFAGYWVGTLAHVVLIAIVLRVVAELLCFAIATAAPGTAGAARRVVEHGVRALYYLGLPLLVAYLLLA